MSQQQLFIKTHQRGAVEITQKVNDIIVIQGHLVELCHVFVAHSSASLMITGSEDSDILLDVEDYLQKIVLDASPKYRHNNEDDFDMSGHIRTILTGEAKTIPIIDNKLGLGQFQGLFLYEHRSGENTRKLIITLS
ncbi:YjbQ family protein [Candidatus Ruthia endofausta]|uniref:YjbQ family protein n=1 Tax=Candidatus Ruthia endofausta TaxID=2738852 RepID=A0A6N0HPA2_9GAMM|nr:secondary thiamine-phosphate synthase enzyme YjbQ [Candidatus Ruthia endofausta]QKQ24111.1 YjbQ family protein [Candidatus Ruthia endofausta]